MNEFNALPQSMTANVEINSTVSIPEGELEFHFTRSRGPGGQNVNKVSTRVELLFNLLDSSHLSYEQKGRIFAALKPRIDAEGTLHVSSQESRSQWKNREIVVEKFAKLLRSALAVRKKRVATKPTRAAKEVRFKAKKSRSSTKKMRGRVRHSDD